MLIACKSYVFLACQLLHVFSGLWPFFQHGSHVSVTYFSSAGKWMNIILVVLKKQDMLWNTVKVKITDQFFFFFCMSGKPLSQRTYMSNMKALSEMVKNVNFFFEVGHRWRSRSQVNFFCMSGKPLSQGTYIPNMKALSESVQNLWPMLKLSNKQAKLTNQ